MNWTDITVALIALIGTAMGTFYGIKKSNSLVEYRLKQLEEKVDVHNRVQERVLIIEQQIEQHRQSIDSLKERLSDHGAQIDTVVTLAEKNEGRINLLERLANK